MATYGDLSHGSYRAILLRFLTYLDTGLVDSIYHEGLRPSPCLDESYFPHPVLIDDVVERQLRQLPVQFQEPALGHPSAVKILLRLEDQPIRVIRVASDPIGDEDGMLRFLQALLPYPMHPGIVQLHICMRHRCPVMAIDIEFEPIGLEQKIRSHRHLTVRLLPLLPGLHIPYRGAEAAQELAHMYLEIYSQTYCVIRMVIHA